MTPHSPPRIRSIVETVLYVDDLARSVEYYARVLGLELMMRDDRFAAFAVASGQVLLLFLRGESAAGIQTGRGFIPGHDAIGRQHLALGASREELVEWGLALGAQVESEVDWPRGGRSLFLRDPDGHLVELVTPGTWANY